MTSPTTVEAGSNTTASPRYNTAIGYLRAFIVVLVVAHHAMLAYHPYAPQPGRSLPAEPRWWAAFPVVDSHRWDGAALLAGFNDCFFMSLLFLLSGLFVWSGLERKGVGSFLRGRLLRLGLPFVAVAAVVAPLAYYPAYLQMTGHSDVAGFVRQWLSLATWPAGPAWFLWVLLVFDCIAALLFALVPHWGVAVGRLLAGAFSRPVAMLAILVAVSAIVYVPLAIAFSPIRWTTFGPFAFQTSRILHYLAYFALGVGIGAYGVNRGLLRADGKLARRWPLWIAAAVSAFAAATVVTVVALTAHPQSSGWAIAYDVMFTVSCAMSCFALLAVFLRFARSRSRMFDSLGRNSYGIYLVHYAFVSWLQFAMLPPSMAGAAKFAIVFVAAVALSWATAALVRRIPGVAGVV